MAAIDLRMTVGPQRELKATVTTEYDKISKLKPGQEVRVKIATDARSISANALSHQWYKDIAFQTGDTPQEVRAFCKLTIGVPIMITESEKFADKYNKSIRRALTHEQKLTVMDLLDVTSLMSKNQMNRYLNTIQQEYANRGVILETPKDAEYAKWIAQR